MIPHTLLIRSLSIECNKWKRRELPTAYVLGVRHGLHVAMQISEVLWALILKRAAANKHYLPMCFDSCRRESKRRLIHG